MNAPLVPKRCQICSRLLDDPTNLVRSRDCGGDCLQCMADCGDPDCWAEMTRVDPENYPVKED